MASSIGVPELAGLANYAAAARVGYGVDETVRRLLRYQWLERTLMRAFVAHLPATPEWEVKGGMALAQWQCAEHVEVLRQRIGEMRHPIPPLDQAPDAALGRFTDELLRSADSVELLTGAFSVTVPALMAEYRNYLSYANPLVDQPTRRVLRFALLELEELHDWGARALAGLLACNGVGPLLRAVWEDHLQAFLGAAGGIAGPAPDLPVSTPTPRARHPFVPDLVPQRDDRFLGQYNFEFPPHVVYDDPRASAAEQNLALLCKRTLEMDVPEMMASVMVERTDLPWEFQRDYSRQLWDEMRHSMMGSVALEARGVDWTQIPLNVGFALRLNQHASALERQQILFAIEHSLMPADTGKRSEYRTAQEAGDELSAHFQDFDWADEVLHTQIGRRWLKHDGITPDQATAAAALIHERTWAALNQYRDREPQTDWWDGFVRQVLGIPSGVPAAERSGHQILAE